MGWGLPIKVKFQPSWWQMVISWWWALVKVEGCCCYLVPKLSLTLLQPRGLYNLPGSSEGISQGIILEWVAISFYKGSSGSQNWTQVPCIGRRILYCWATKEAPTKTYVIRLYFRWRWGWVLKKKKKILKNLSLCLKANKNYTGWFIGIYLLLSRGILCLLTEPKS